MYGCEDEAEVKAEGGSTQGAGKTRLVKKYSIIEAAYENGRLFYSDAGRLVKGSPPGRACPASAGGQGWVKGKAQDEGYKTQD
ncbi:MAG TPA: hypothetical protein DCP74_15430 [Bacteroidales bacterium]|nr:hypothetical protein [Bacteroidales bacterium]